MLEIRELAERLKDVYIDKALDSVKFARQISSGPAPTDNIIWAVLGTPLHEMLKDCSGELQDLVKVYFQECGSWSQLQNLVASLVEDHITSSAFILKRSQYELQGLMASMECKE